jgi:Fe2+ transport system protein FeoA
VTDDAPLTAAALGAQVVVARFADGISTHHLEQLMSYGLAEGRTIAVLRHRPMTVVLVDHTELALEHGIAACVRVVPA